MTDAVRGRLVWEPVAVVCFGLIVVGLLPNRYKFHDTEVRTVLMVVPFVLALLALAFSARPHRHVLVSRTVVVLCWYLTGVVVMSLAQLVAFALTHKSADVEGIRLFATVVSVWVLGIAVFALWYWQLDRGGPYGRDSLTQGHLDLLFTAMTVDELKDWKPTFITYLFLSFTTATAFSPTDTMPLTDRARLLMMGQAMISLTIMVVAAARAIGLLT